MAFSLFHCAPINDMRKREKAKEYLLQGQKLLAQGDYEGALREYQKALTVSDHKALEDQALFNMGLVYVHSGYPKRDYKKSLNFFTKILNDCPQSPLVEQAKIWIGILQENEELNQVIQKLKEVDIEIEERKREKAK